MATKNETLVTGVFNTRVDATRAIQMLEEKGFQDSEISLLMSDSVGEDFQIKDSSKMPEGLAAGATAGGVIGALVAGLTAVGTIATGGGLLIAGPLVAVLAGGGAGAGVGGIIGGLTGAGMTEHEAKLFADEIEDGRILVAVHCSSDERKDTAEDVFEVADGAVSVE
ncbi:MAG: hypothetical protein WD342_06190 [Verrucomicrobiales bacterium]